MITVGIGIALALSVRTSEPVSLRRSAFVSAASGSAMPAALFGTTVPMELATLLRELNAARRLRGLRELVMDPRLCAIARLHGLDMAARRYFGHISPEGETPFERMTKANYRYAFAGENLALDRDAASANRAFRQSNDHRENMLEPHYAKVGIAAVTSPRGEIFVEDFSD